MFCWQNLKHKHRFENVLSNQCELDEAYNSFKNTIVREMDWMSDYKYSRHRKKFKYYKPYWNLELMNLWLQMRNAEKNFTRCKGSRQERNRYRALYALSQKHFDRKLKQAKRKYEYDVANELDEINTEDPRKFWKYLNNLGPKVKDDIPMKVKDDNGGLISDESYVYEKWKNDFEQVYNPFEHNPDLMNEFDNEFWSYCKNSVNIIFCM